MQGGALGGASPAPRGFRLSWRFFQFWWDSGILLRRKFMASCKSCSSSGGCPHSTLTGGSGQCGGQENPQDQAISATVAKIKHTLFIMSGKGGVGKSSVAVNLAVALQMRGYRVGILDIDLHGPSVPRLLGLESTLRADPETAMIIPARIGEDLEVVSMDALLEDKDQAIVWRGPMKAQAIRQFLSEVDWGSLDFLLIDSPPGTGDEHMTVLKAIPDAQSVVVTTPQEISLADVRKAINFLQGIGAPILGLIENMSGLFCPNCGEEINLFKKGGGKELAEKLGLRFLGAIPLDPATVVAADLGRPIVSLEENGPAKAAFLHIAEEVASLCGVEKSGNG